MDDTNVTTAEPVSSPIDNCHNQMTTNPLKIQQITAGKAHSLLLLSDGSVWGTGTNSKGQLGAGTTANTYHWTQIHEAVSGVTQVAAGRAHSLLLKADGSVWATGYNYAGQLGDGSNQTKTTWEQVIAADPENPVTQIAAGESFSLACRQDGSVWATGINHKGQLGDKTTADKNSWTQIHEAGDGVTQVAAGGFHSLLLKTDGSVWATGANYYGQLGNNDSNQQGITCWESVSEPNSTNPVTQVAAGYYFSLVRRQDGSVWATGLNDTDQLGILYLDGDSGYHLDSQYSDIFTNVFSANKDPVTQVAAGFEHALLLTQDGSVWATGGNTRGQLGVGNVSNQDHWTTVPTPKSTQIAAGHWHSLLVDEDGLLWVTGTNTSGQLGLPAIIEKVDTWLPHSFWHAYMLEQQMAERSKNGERVLESDDEPVFSL